MAAAARRCALLLLLASAATRVAAAPRAALAVTPRTQAPHLPPFPPYPPPPPTPPAPPPADTTADTAPQPSEGKQTTAMYYVYGGILGFCALSILAFCMWKGTAQLRSVSKDWEEVVKRREFLEKQEAATRPKGAPAPGAAGLDGAVDRDARRKAKAAERGGQAGTAAIGALALLSLA